MDNKFKIARSQHASMKLNRGQCYSSCKGVQDDFRKLDKFGHAITLTYKGRDKFQTTWGASVSLIVCLAMTWVILIMISQVVTQPFQSRQIISELVNPDLAAKAGIPPPVPVEEEDEIESFVDDDEEEVEPPYEYQNDPMMLEAAELNDLLTFINVEGLKENLIVVSSGQIQQKNITIKNGIEGTFSDCQLAHGCKLINDQPVQLYESQNQTTYDTWTKTNYNNSDYFAIFFEPCSDENTSVKCSGKSKVFGAL